MTLAYILLYALIAVLSALIYVMRKNLNYWKDRGIPYDEPHIFYGNLKGFRKYRLLQDIHSDIYFKYKGKAPFCGFFFFQRPSALILDTKLAKNILIRDFNYFVDRGVFHNEKDDPLTGHLFALDGAKWKKLRQRLSPTFTSGKMKFMFPTVVNVAEQFVQVLKSHVERNNIIEIKELLARFTTDVIGTCAFGIECNSLKDPNAEFRMMGKKFLEVTRHGAVLNSFIAAFPKLARRLHMRSIDEGVHQFFMRIVKETVAMRERNNIKRNDFMDLLIALKNTNSIELENGEVLKGLTIEEVAAQAFVFFLAGFETSSTAMGFTLYEIAIHQEIQDKMRKEINEVFAKHDNTLTYECMKEMHYVEQVLSETLRHHTIITGLFREAIADYKVPDSPGLVIEKGTRVLIPASAYHHDPELYPNPNEFNPDRFSPEMVANRDSVEWLPFGDGPRNCIGLRFGKMQARIGLISLLKNFKFSVCPKTLIPMEYDPKGLVLTAKGGIFLNVEKV